MTRLMFIGEAPGADEDRLGEPFVGRAGQLLNDIIVLKGMGLARDEVYIAAAIIKYRPPRKPLAHNWKRWITASLIWNNRSRSSAPRILPA